MPEPTVEQISAYLHATGWDRCGTGTAGTLWILNRPGHHADGRRLGVPDDFGNGYPLNEVVVRIAAAEHRNAVDVRNDILDVDNPVHAYISAWIIGSMCERGAAVVHRYITEANDDGWPGVQGWHQAEAMHEQATALAAALDRTAVLIKAAFEADPSAPRHPLWNAAVRAAEAILLAEPSTPDDLEEIQRRLAEYRKQKEDRG